MAMDTSKLKQIGEKAKVKNRSATISLKHVLRLKDNTELDTCCRDAPEHDVEFFQTPGFNGPATGADLMVMTCSCGKKHTVMGGGGAKANPDGQVA